MPAGPERNVRMTLGRLTPQQLKQHGIPVPEQYYRLPNSMTFDFLAKTARISTRFLLELYA